MMNLRIHLLGSLSGLMLLWSCGTSPTTRTDPGLPGVISQEAWGGLPFDGEARTHALTRMTLHHSGETYTGEAPTAEYLRRFQRWCKDDKQWIDIPYHFMIDLEGNIFEGRRLRYAGDTNTNYDPAGHALICVLGNYEHQEPNSAQLDAVVRLTTSLARSFRIDPGTILGHRDVADGTVCPGANLFAYLTSGYFVSAVRQHLSTP